MIVTVYQHLLSLTFLEDHSWSELVLFYLHKETTCVNLPAAIHVFICLYSGPFFVMCLFTCTCVYLPVIVFIYLYTCLFTCTCIYLPVQWTFLCQNPSTTTSSDFWFFSLKIKNKTKLSKRSSKLTYVKKNKFMVWLFEWEWI